MWTVKNFPEKDFYGLWNDDIPSWKRRSNKKVLSFNTIVHNMKHCILSLIIRVGGRGQHSPKKQVCNLLWWLKLSQSKYKRFTEGFLFSTFDSLWAAIWAPFSFYCFYYLIYLQNNLRLDSGKSCFMIGAMILLLVLSMFWPQWFVKILGFPSYLDQ